MSVAFSFCGERKSAEWLRSFSILGGATLSALRQGAPFPPSHLHSFSFRHASEANEEESAFVAGDAF